jgi:hypothetical protein
VQDSFCALPTKKSVTNRTRPQFSISDWSIILIGQGGFATSSSHVYAVLDRVLLVGLPEKKQLNLDI